MSKHVITLIPGDGIGPEITDAMCKVIEAAGVDIEWHRANGGEAVMEKEGTPLPQSLLDSVAETKIAIKGPLTTPVGAGFRSINVALRKYFDLYINLRPTCSIPGTGARYNDVDLVIFRENTEDLYAGIEVDEGTKEAAEIIDWIRKNDLGAIRDDAAISIKPISITASERIIRAAFEYALANNRKKVTAVHKANIMKYTDGLWLHTAQRIATEYEGRVEFDNKIVDATCMGLVINPSNFDVMVLPNLYGDIVSDLCAGLVGGLGIAPGANIGKDIAIFEPVHGSAPIHAGKNEANPTAQILSGCMMLDHIGEQEAAHNIRTALNEVYAKGERVTYDIKRILTGSTAGCVGTSEFADAIIAELQ